jgi:Ca2+-transporting ATPase
MLLRRCSHAKLRDGKVVPLTPQLRSQIEDEISSIGDRALRCIGLAFKDDSLVPQLQNENHQYNDYLKDSSIFEVIESDLVFVGITAIRDPPRDGVAESIDLCKQAGIRVVMITGDSKSTSVAIAKDVHIFKENHEEGTTTSRAYEGREFFALPEAEQFDVLKSGNLVICRAEPSDKQRLVKMLQSIDEIPA